ncbi:MAG: PfkB family carbohydrate kinase, partial [Candidatus Omnitrophica bacterium]|nr:PfkB family carbohydrate kinase [Candidatus Omnitrophota bacterium]
ELSILANTIIQKLNPKALLITLGENGMMLFSDKISKHIPTTALEVFDVTGAGDTVIAVFTLALTGGASFLEAAIISNFAAGIVVGKLGAATTNREELIKRITKSS